MDFKSLLSIAIQTTITAGTEIMRQYVDGFDTVTKADGSPVTSADLKAHDILNEHLSKTGIAVMSEEGEKFTHEFRQNNDYWCIDPIDGTMDFVNKTDEFCISVGLITQNTSKLGVLYAPALGLLYFAAEGVGAYKFFGDQKAAENLLATSDFWDELIENSEDLPVYDLPENFTFLTSRYHRDQETDQYIQELKKKYNEMQVITMGCAIKLGIVAEREATEYTRFRSVNFWDIAGGHAIAKYAGLEVLKPNTTQEIDYTDPEMRVDGYSLKW
ncbi:hypothetical protein GO491_01780 [Flavobacteriaceae bacterium Ap0902]|nr:hypothetical protein [Flavobacteriaceae bacterium Ap0902]